MTNKVRSISPQQLHAIWQDGEKINLIDVRTPAEYRAGHIAGAQLIPLDELSSQMLPIDEQYAGVGHEQTLYLTCQAGQRAQQAAKRLLDAGYQNLRLIAGGRQTGLYRSDEWPGTGRSAANGYCSVE